jgi:hypothetical protein
MGGPPDKTFASV